jgi:hypothetical protein
MENWAEEILVKNKNKNGRKSFFITMSIVCNRMKIKIKKSLFIGLLHKGFICVSLKGN